MTTQGLWRPGRELSPKANNFITLTLVREKLSLKAGEVTFKTLVWAIASQLALSNRAMDCFSTRTQESGVNGHGSNHKSEKPKGGSSLPDATTSCYMPSLEDKE